MARQLASEAANAAQYSSPPAVSPAALLALGQTVSACSEESARTLLLRAHEAALALRLPDQSDSSTPLLSRIRQTRREVYSEVSAWLASTALKRNDPDLLVLARTLAGRIEYGPDSVRREEVYLPIVDSLAGFREYSEVRSCLSQVEKEDGRLPFAMYRSLLAAGLPAELRSELLKRGYQAISEGSCDSTDAAGFLEATREAMPREEVIAAIKSCFLKRSHEKRGDLAPARQFLGSLEGSGGAAVFTVPAPSNDPMAAAYEEIQAAAEESTAAVARRALSIEDTRNRQALLVSCVTALQKAGKAEAAERVSQVLSSFAPAMTAQEHPADYYLAALASASGEQLRVQVEQALAAAESILAKANKAYQAADSDSERLEVYENASQEAVALYAHVAELDFDRAAASALRVLGPQRAEVLTAVLGAACK